MILVFLPFVLQAILMLFDEFYYHRKRGLPLWERVGHPLDTLTAAACVSVCVFLPPSETNLNLFIALAIFSSLFITKDEFVHLSHCPPLEQWLHALLFVVHPTAMFSLAYLWQRGGFETFFKLELLAMIAFSLYQFVYWSFVWKKSTIQSTTN